jgi:aminoglycoside phosphotransferase (APT) family kinase protein
MFPPLPGLLRWRMLDGAGWQFLLPRPPYSRLLCHDTLDGATMLLAASLADETWVVYQNEGQLERLRQTASDAGLTGIRFERAGPEAGASAPAGGSLGPGEFDGALLHDPGGLLVRRGPGAAPDLTSLVGALASRLRPDGFLYVGMRNRLGYDRLRGDGAGRGRLFSVTTVAGVLRRAGFPAQRLHPYLCDGTRLLEVVPPSGYRSAKNRFLRSERLREIVLRGFGLRHFAPAYGLVALREGRHRSWLDCLLADDWVRSLAPSPVIRRSILLNNGKVVLSLGRAGARHGDVVLVLSPDVTAADRRREEAVWLQRLRALPGAPTDTLPVFHGEREIDGVRVFALSELPGMTVDHDSPRLPRLTAAAARWISDLHAATARPTRMTPEALDDLAAPIFAAARLRYPELEPELARAEQSIRAELSGHTLPLVFMHGDFKLENVVFDEHDGRLTGVIDWELARHPGPPLLDLLYLLGYNRVVRERGHSLLALVAAAGLLPWTVEERARIDEYHARHGCRGLERALCGLFIVHHLAMRTHYLLDDERLVKAMRDLLSNPWAAAAAAAC